MALYPIRLLKDKNRHPFFPFNTLESVLVDGTNKTLADVLDDIYNKEEINTMFATELSKFSVYPTVQSLPTTARDGAVAAVNANDTYMMYMYYNGSWHILTQSGNVNDVKVNGISVVENKVANINVPTNTSDLTNDSGFITSDDIPVNSVNNKTGNVVLTASDIGIGTVFTLKGSVATPSDLPSTGNVVGDVYYVESEEVGYIWLEKLSVLQWEQLGLPIDLSNYYNKTETNTLLNAKQNEITSSNKLNSDLINDTNSTNKFVTTSDKTNWNGKEDAINKTTEITSSSTNTQYPSAKAVYDKIGPIEIILDEIIQGALDGDNKEY